MSRGGCTLGVILAVFIALIACPARHPQEAVNHIARVIVVSRDRARLVEVHGGGALAEESARAGSVERRNGAVASAKEAVNGTAHVKVVSRDRTPRVDTLGESPLAAERRDDAVASALETVNGIARI